MCVEVAKAQGNRKGRAVLSMPKVPCLCSKARCRAQSVYISSASWSAESYCVVCEGEVCVCVCVCVLSVCGVRFFHTSNPINVIMTSGVVVV